MNQYPTLQIKTRRADLNDLDQIRFLFRDTITVINSADYNQEETRVWSEGYKNPDHWTKKISEQYFLVATSNDKIIGFSSIDGIGYLDFLYVHKDFQRKGVATRLLTEIEKQAEKSSLNKIFSHVSKTARTFFEKNNFHKTGEEIKKVGNIEFVVSVMEKTR
ncbi:MAG: GNAT family N-acetyltransferase [Saprospiraceae bacterium]